MRCMPRVTRHLRVGYILVLLVIFSCVPLQAGATTVPALIATTAPKVIITEVQMTGSSASEEFIELYNTTDTDIDLADAAHTGKEPWKLQFFSATSTSSGTPDWTKPSATVSLTGTIPARNYFVLGSTGYAPGGLDSDQVYGSRLSDTGGGLQLVTASSAATTYYDRVMWKQAAAGQTLPVSMLPTPDAKGSLQRVPNDDSEYINTDGTLADFTLAADISPKDFWREPVPPEVPDNPEIPPADSTSGGDATPEAPAIMDNTGLEAPYLTELLPNPAAPLTDESDEFIELYNPNATAFDLKGYTLEVGTTTLHDFTFGDSEVLAPLAYTAFYSRDTKLSLTNSGGQARLLDPAGTKLDETPAYGAADDGASWSLDAVDGTTWGWSTTATPNTINSITLPVTPVKTSTTAAKTTAKPKAAAKVKGTTTTKSKAKAAPKKKAAKAAKAKLTTASKTTDVPQRAPIHTAVLVTVVAIAVLYAAYEYRHDIQNRLYKLRHNRAVRAYARQ
jgi:hypothetical protein